MVGKLNGIRSYKTEIDKERLKNILSWDQFNYYLCFKFNFIEINNNNVVNNVVYLRLSVV